MVVMADGGATRKYFDLRMLKEQDHNVLYAEV